ncbi:toll/interleukin-1 receptor domain-containing protein [Umezawaea sp. Da 62-37]|uniref:tetratricopeptide repeat protein n=1 Tax=Umezawaea sp. Da 62-37 TaxID=3075927 RepID=UPI0028F70483|nr:toll/interleukin-1 receptor domain-containing protein [Umezawaea sp. Da 62-37]WNV83917.1 toll/interleukin-1 receptor domain-containing protein [Umezawaea sp. Da 62-37]
MTHRTRPQVFLSYTWADEPAVDLIEQALRARGVAVFRDKDLSLFDPITGHLARELDESAVLLAFYSRRYPLRYACQWELTRAFLAALRHGDPRDRVLVANPEPDENHIAPVELTDAVYSSWTGAHSADALADAVTAKLAATGGVPLGSPPEDGELHARLTRPRRFVGRYRELWAVHSALHGGRLWLAHEPAPDSAVVLKAPAGMGKTVLAEQYAFLFRDAYPGGVEWVDLAGAPADRVLGHFAAAVARFASARFGLDLGGLAPDQVIGTVGDRLTAEGRDVLWVVDDVPDGIGEAVDRLVLPSPRAHTVLTARTTSPAANLRAVPVGGLTAQEVEELFRAQWPSINREESRAIAVLTERWGGHPVTLLPMIRELREAQGTGALDEVLRREPADDPVVDDLARAVRDRSAHARAVLEFASVLAPAPFTGDLLVEGVSPRLESATPMLVAEALRELEEFSLLHRADRVPRTRQMWRLHALVGDAVRRDIDPAVLSSVAHRAAVVISAALTTPEAPLDLHLHALRIVACEQVPVPMRLALLREVALRHEERGDIPAAHDARATAVRVAGAAVGVPDLLAAARLAVAAGDTAAALARVAELVERARADQDGRTEFRARFLAAAAHDLSGDYTGANEVFHDHRVVAEHGSDPVWLPEEERVRVGLARVAALRLRGDYRVAATTLDQVLPVVLRAQPVPDHRGARPGALLERARLRLLTGKVLESRQDATGLIEMFAAAGVPRHHLARQAVAVLAEAELTLAWSEMRARPREWDQAVKQVRRALDESTEWFGPDNPLTLELHVLRGQTLHNNSRHAEALEVLADAERRIADSLGDDHPLRFKARQWTGLSTMGLGDWASAVVIFDELLPRQTAVLGRGHPESQLTRFQLGICLAKIDVLDRARPLIAEAKKVLVEQHGPWQQWASIARVGSVVTSIPKPLWKVFNALDDVMRKRGV